LTLFLISTLGAVVATRFTGSITATHQLTWLILAGTMIATAILVALLIENLIKAIIHPKNTLVMRHE